MGDDGSGQGRRERESDWGGKASDLFGWEVLGYFSTGCVSRRRRRGVRPGLTFITSSSSDFVTFWMVPAARIARAASRPRPRGATRDALASGAATATLLREASDDWRRARARVPLAARLATVSAQARMLLFGVDVTLTRRPSDVKSRPVTSERAGCGGGERPSVQNRPSPTFKGRYFARFLNKWINLDSTHRRAVRFRERFRRLCQPLPAQHDFVASCEPALGRSLPRRLLITPIAAPTAPPWRPRPQPPFSSDPRGLIATRNPEERAPRRRALPAPRLARAPRSRARARRSPCPRSSATITAWRGSRFRRRDGRSGSGAATGATTSPRARRTTAPSSSSSTASARTRTTGATPCPRSRGGDFACTRCACWGTGGLPRLRSRTAWSFGGSR